MTHLWVVVFVMAGVELAAMPGTGQCAFADAGGAAAITGGFFLDDPAPVALPTTAAMPDGVPMAANDSCDKAVTVAGAGHALPPGLMNAIAVVESGRLDPQTGSPKPWPWTIDANGTGYFYDSPQAAIAAAAAFEAAGINSLDVGCMQVNLAQHPGAFSSLAAAFDPLTNAQYAAGFLTSLEQKFGNWPQAVAAYHSQTQALGAPYAAKVYAQWQGGAAPAALPVAVAQAEASGGGMMAQAMISPLRDAVPLDMGSLMPPAARLLRTSGAGSNRSLASYRANPIAIAGRPPPQG